MRYSAGTGKRIDPHCHCRDGREAYKATIKSVSKRAQRERIVHICDMPNTNPPILKETDVIARLELARRKKLMTGYSLYIGLTCNRRQIEEAVRVHDKYQEVVGLKLYPPENESKAVYRELSRLGYSGVLAIHAEKASFFRPRMFNPKKPWTHNLAQPPEAEMESIKEQILFAEEANFRGTLYICHITLPESAEIIWQAKKHISIYSEVTPHHLLLSDLQMMGRDGILLKVNPPLRERSSVAGLLRAVKQGLVDCIGTDYAPHTLAEKKFPPYLSGIASYEFYGLVLEFLREQGASDKQIEELTYWNIKKIFGQKLEGV